MNADPDPTFQVRADPDLSLKPIVSGFFYDEVWSLRIKVNNLLSYFFEKKFCNFFI